MKKRREIMAKGRKLKESSVRKLKDITEKNNRNKSLNELPWQVQPLYLCFSECDEADIPHNKNDVKSVLKALKSFSNGTYRTQRNSHKLVGEYTDTYSIDVGKRGGENGDKRLLYRQNNNIIKVIKLFTGETHKSK